MNLLLPDEDPENKFRYNKSELKWCEENEKYIWQYIIDQEILYEKDFNKISYFFNPGPYTKNFGKDSSCIHWDLARLSNYSRLC